MYVIVIGRGKVGFPLTKALLATENEVVVTDRDAHRCELVTDQLGSVVISGDGSEPSVLREAGAGRCDVLIATTGSDGDNLVACQVAKARFNVARTIAVVNDPQHLPLFKMLGIDVPISTTDLILSHIEEELPAHQLMHVMSLKEGNREVVCVKVPADSQAVGRALCDVAMPPEAAVALVIGKEGKVRSLDADLRLEAEDEVVALTTPENEEKLWQVLTSGG